MITRFKNSRERVRYLLTLVLPLLWFSACEEPSTVELLEEKGIATTPESLLRATVDNHAHLLSLLTGAGVAPDESRDEAGHTALMLAARHGYTEAAEILMSESHDLNLVDERGMTALAHSICSEQYGIAERLLEFGASADATCHHQQPLVVTAVMQSHQRALELLLEHGATDGLDDALLIAVTERKLPMVKPLLERGASPDAGAGFAMPVLNVALQNGDTDCVDLLLDAGSDPNRRDDDAMTALGYAISAGDADLVGRLIEHGADPDRPCIGEQIAIEAAVGAGDAEMLDQLLTAGAAIHPRVVSRAVDGDAPGILAVLLDHGADIDTPDSDGDPLLVRAIRAGDASQVRLLIERGATLGLQCREGQSLIALATALRQHECLAELIRAGADPDKPLNSPISDEFRALVDHRTFTYYTKRDSRFTPIMIAACHGHGDTLRVLLEGGASTGRYTRNWKRYPISLASEAGHIEAQQLLVGYDPETREDHFKIVITLSSQRAVMYKNGEVHLSSRVSTGKKGYRTPTGEFVVTHKHRTHTSTLYHSPMPYFMRLSCKAFGTHVGYVPNYPASHGCIRMPHDNARAFFNAAPRGTPVSIVN